MTRNNANKWLADHGFPGLQVDKAEGVWYVIGGYEDERIDRSAERCLHVVRLEDLDESCLRQKLSELTDVAA